MRTRVVAAGVAVVLPIIALVVAVSIGRDGGPDRLPVAATGGSSGDADDSRSENATGAWSIFPGPVTYQAAPDLPELEGQGRAYHLPGGLNGDRLAALAAAFGLDGEPVVADGSWGIEGDDGSSLTVFEGSGLPWSYVGAGFGGVVFDSGSACEGCEPAAKEAAVERPADLPSEEEAEAKAREVLATIGVNLEGARTEVTDQVTAWWVTFEPAVDGMPTSGFTTSLTIGAGRAVEAGYGHLSVPEAADEYPLIGTTAAIEAMNEGGGLVPGDGGLSEPQECPPATCTTVPPIEVEPVVVTLTAVQQGLMLVPSTDGSEAWLVPAYLFEAEDGNRPAAMAVAAEFLEPPADEPADEPVEEPVGDEPAPVGSDTPVVSLVPDPGGAGSSGRPVTTTTAG
ncbi:hypothetical protein BH18ACT4_BH18ACT4_07860 [soil metagenome]